MSRAYAAALVALLSAGAALRVGGDLGAAGAAVPPRKLLSALGSSCTADADCASNLCAGSLCVEVSWTASSSATATGTTSSTASSTTTATATGTTSSTASSTASSTTTATTSSTATTTATKTSTGTASGSVSLSGTASPTFSPSGSRSRSVSATVSTTLSPSRSASASRSMSTSVTESASESTSVSPSGSPSLSRSGSVSPTMSRSPSMSPTDSRSRSATVTGSRSGSSTPSHSGSRSVTPSASASQSLSFTAPASRTHSPTQSGGRVVGSASGSASVSFSPSPSVSVSGTASLGGGGSATRTTTGLLAATQSASTSLSPSASVATSPSAAVTPTATTTPMPSAIVTWKITVGASVPASTALNSVVAAQLRCGAAAAAGANALAAIGCASVAACASKILLVSVRDSTAGQEVLLGRTAAVNAAAPLLSCASAAVYGGTTESPVSWITRTSDNSSAPALRRRAAAVGDGVLVATIAFEVVVPLAYASSNATFQALNSSAIIWAGATTLSTALVAASLPSALSKFFVAVNAKTGVSVAALAVATSAGAPSVFLLNRGATAGVTTTTAVTGTSSSANNMSDVSNGEVAGIVIGVTAFLGCVFIVAKRRAHASLETLKKSQHTHIPPHLAAGPLGALHEDARPFDVTNPLAMASALSRSALAIARREADVRPGNSRPWIEAHMVETLAAEAEERAEHERNAALELRRHAQVAREKLRTPSRVGLGAAGAAEYATPVTPAVAVRSPMAWNTEPRANYTLGAASGRSLAGAAAGGGTPAQQPSGAAATPQLGAMPHPLARSRFI